MRAMVFDRYGEPDVMRVRDVPVPEPQDGEVLIRVRYAGVNPADSKARAGDSARAGYGLALPYVTGMDAAGVVERAGSNVNEFVQGDRVMFVTGRLRALMSYSTPWVPPPYLERWACSGPAAG